MVIFKVILGISLMSSPCLADSWYTQSPKGWLWYKHVPKPKLPLDKKTEKVESTNSVNKSAPPSYRERMKQVRQSFDELQAKAILEPTLDNVQTMQNAQNAIMDRSTAFEKMWMLASMLNAQNYRESDQPYPAHRQIYQEKEDQQLDLKIKALAQQYGLFFVFKQNCRYCHEFAPIVRQLIDRYGFDYKAISADGNTLPEFPEAVSDNGAIQLINREGIYPALFLVHPQTRQVIPVARGLINDTELRANLKTIIHSLEGGRHGR